MMRDNAKKPALRFAGFDGDWKRRKLGEVIEEITRTDPESTAPIMMITANNGFIEQSERYAFNNAGESLKKYVLLKKGELAYNHGASKLRPYGSCFALTTAEKARIPFVYHCFSVGQNDPEFMSIQLNGHGTEAKLRKIVSSGARMDGLLNISFEEYATISVLLPDIAEQMKIAAYFRHLDHLIALHQRKYAKLMNIKKSMLEKMFPQNGSTVPEIRFAGFTGDWERRKLGELGQTYTGLSGKTKEDFGHGQAHFVTYMNVFSNTVTNPEMVEPIEIDLRQNEVEAGDVFFTTSSETPEEVGMSSVLLEKHGKVYLNSFCFGFRPTKKMDSYYLAYMLRSSVVRSKIVLLAQGISRYNISKNKVMEIDVPLPKINEQKLIGEYFQHLDHLIALHQRKLDRLQNIKKACLEKMFV